MAVLLFILSVLAFLVGALMFLAANGAIQEAVGACVLVVSAVLFSGACIVSAVQSASAKLLAKNEEIRVLQEHTNKLLEWLGRDVIGRK